VSADAWAVVFDLDGVLVDSYDAHRWSWERLADETGVRFTDADFTASFGQTSREVIARHWGAAVGSDRNRALDDRKESLYRDRLRAAFPAVDGAVALIDALRAAGVALAVGSSAPPENVELTLALLDRRAAFAVVVTGRDVARGKPDPAIYTTCAARLGLPPRRCVVVEDAPVGVAAARAAGMRCVGLTGTTDAAALADADLVVASLRDLSPPRLAALLPRS
jgi:HAD superfamily hydrolase (TIGR01509 family)